MIDGFRTVSRISNLHCVVALHRIFRRHCRNALSSVSDAGNSLDQICRLTYQENEKIVGYNISTEIAGGGFGVNVKFKKENLSTAIWELMSLKQAEGRDRSVIIDIIKTAYLSNASVNVCRGGGYFTGIELSK